jgi:hypothetical protein
LSHWINEIEDIIPDLSVRARNVLRKYVPSLSLFLEMDRESILKLRNCGVKTADELVYLRDSLRKTRFQQQELFEDLSHKNDSIEISVKLTRPAKKLLEEHGCGTKDPMEWDLDTVLENVSPKSRPLKLLAEYKVEYWCKKNKENRKTSADLEKVYLKYWELPFSATLCGVSITEARKRLRNFVTNVKKLKNTKFNSISDEINFLLPEDDRNRYICIRRVLPWGDTLESLGEEKGLTRERVRQIEEKARGQVTTKILVAAHRLKYIKNISQRVVDVGGNLTLSGLQSISSNEYGNFDEIIATLCLTESLEQYPNEISPVIEASHFVLPRMEMNRRLRYNKVDSPPKERIVWDSSVDVLVRSRR